MGISGLASFQRGRGETRRKLSGPPRRAPEEAHGHILAKLGPSWPEFHGLEVRQRTILVASDVGNLLFVGDGCHFQQRVACDGAYPLDSGRHWRTKTVLPANGAICFPLLPRHVQ